jgi:hypothetical protein
MQIIKQNFGKFKPEPGLWAQISGELYTKMNWRAHNAATSSQMDLDGPKGGEENFADSPEEELAYCALVLDSIVQGGLAEGTDDLDLAIVASFLDDIIQSAANFRLAVGRKQVSPDGFESTEAEVEAGVVREVRDYVVALIDNTVEAEVADMWSFAPEKDAIEQMSEVVSVRERVREVLGPVRELERLCEEFSSNSTSSVLDKAIAEAQSAIRTLESVRHKIKQ